MSVEFVLEYAIWGGLGGLVGIVAKCGYIELPRLKEGRIYLGAIQGILFGIVAGLIGDVGPINALMWGVGGTTVIQGIISAVEQQHQSK